jgi:REP element-mobilizing transposase RayT
VIAGKAYLVTRRTAQRQFLLKPSQLTTNTFGYVLAVAAAKYRILVHVIAVLSNHYHLVITDPRAELPAFLQYLDSLVARAMNASYGRWESFWAPGSFSGVVLAGSEDVVEKCAYALANPVAAGLSASGCEWPGLWSPPEAVGTAWRAFQRPAHFFSADGSMPERAVLELTAAPGLDVEEFRALLADRLREKEQEAAQALAREGRRFMGERKILAQKHTDHPAPGEPRRRLSPRVAARDKWKRIEAIGRLRSFLIEYRSAVAKLRAGVEDVVFPEGTYQLRVLLGVTCAGAG